MMKPQEFQLACLFLQDSQRLIAAGKIQRWEIVKWAVALNIGLAAVSLVDVVGPAAFILCVGVAIVSIFLIFHYNRRMTGARKSSKHLDEKLSKEVISIQQLTGEGPYSDDLRNYDCLELCMFPAIVVFSILPSYLVWVLNFQRM